MRHMLLCFRSPNKDNYVGGVMTLINSYISHKEMFEKNRVEIDIFDYHVGGVVERLPQKISNLLYIPLQRKAFSKYVRNNKTDIVSIHTSREFLFLKDVYLARYISKKFKKKVLLTVHVGDVNTVFNRIGFWQDRLIQIINSDVDKVILLSNEIKSQFIKLGMKPEKCEVLYNFYDFGGYRFEEKTQSDELKLLYVGAIHREKGILELLHAVKKVSQKGYNIHLDICGQVTDFSIQDEFNHILNEQPAVFHLHGYVSGEVKAALYDQASALVLPSYHEGMPLVILEALGSGCAIISTRVGTTPEVLSEENAIWVNIGSEDEIVTAIIRLITDRAMMKKMSRKNIEKSSDYSITEHIAKYCKIVNS